MIYLRGEGKRTEQRDVGGSIVYVERYPLIFKIKIPTWAEAEFTWGLLKKLLRAVFNVGASRIYVVSDKAVWGV